MRWLKMLGGGSFAFFAVAAAVVGLGKDGFSGPTVIGAGFLGVCAWFGVRAVINNARRPREHQAKLLELEKAATDAAGATAAAAATDADADMRRRAAASRRERQ